MTSPDPSAILTLVCNYFGVAPGDVLGRHRNHSIVRARHVAIYLTWLHCFHEGGFDHLGRLFNRDQGSIRSARYLIPNQARKESGLAETLLFLNEQIAKMRTPPTDSAAAGSSILRIVPTPVGYAVDIPLRSCRPLADPDGCVRIDTPQVEGILTPDRPGKRAQPPASDNSRAQPTDLSTTQDDSAQRVA